MGFLYSQLFVTPAIPTTPLTGQTIIVTGSNTGLGFEAARHIARLGPAKLILAVRNLEAGNKARETIVSSTGCEPSAIEVWFLDLSSFESVLAFSDRVDKTLDRVDGISLNAGIQTKRFDLVEGYERTLTVNVISTYLLALAMIPKLRETAQKFGVIPRLSIISSETHAWASFEEKKTPQDQGILAALSDPDTKTMQSRYMTSKLIQVLVFRHITPLIGAQSKKEGSQICLNIVNPGLAHSDMQRDEDDWMYWLVRTLLARTQEKGGRPIAAGVVAGPEADGMYMHDGVVDQKALSAYVLSEEGEKCGERLWLELKAILEGARKGITLGL